MHDLLSDAIIPAPLREGGVRFCCLPQLYAELVRDDVESFPGLGAHQGQAWYQFLVQVGALALLRDEWQGPPPDAAETWRDLLAALTPGGAETAWSLIVSDATKPALLQPPTEKITEFSIFAETPDRLDILVTAKNHDRKQAAAAGGAPHHWLYALVTTQTASGFSGRGNYGVARMNGGLSSRVLIDRRPSHRWGPRVARGIRMLCIQRQRLMEQRGGGKIFDDEDDGMALAWLAPWDTDAMLPTRDLDLYFVEVCRRIRLSADGEGRIRALGRPSAKPRVDAGALNGNLADPWAPVERGGKALTVGGNGFNYRLAQRILLTAEFEKPLSLGKLAGEECADSEVHMAVLVRGQGKTEGLHERIIKLPHSIAEHLDLNTPAPESGDSDSDGTAARPLEALSERMVGRAAEARRVLRQAMIVYLQGPEHPDFQGATADPVTQRYDGVLDEHFFAVLFRESAGRLDFAQNETAWQRLLRFEAFGLAEEVWAGGGAPAARREKARAASEAVLWGGLRRHLPLAFPTPEDKAA